MVDDEKTMIKKLLEDEGFKVIEGHDAVIAEIVNLASDVSVKLCSGYGVHPDGSKCGGCKDCKGPDKVKTYC